MHIYYDFPAIGESIQMHGQNSDLLRMAQRPFHAQKTYIENISFEDDFMTQGKNTNCIGHWARKFT